LFLLAVLTISLLAVSQSVVTQIRRDREQEMVHRGQQYVRAIRRYYRSSDAIPPRSKTWKFRITSASFAAATKIP